MIAYSGWMVLDRQAMLDGLLAAGVRPVHGDVVADHITLSYPATRPAPAVDVVHVVGHVAGDVAQSLVVAVQGTTCRPDGHVFHITYSLTPGTPHVAGRDLLDHTPITLLPAAIPVRVAPFLRPTEHHEDPTDVQAVLTCTCGRYLPCRHCPPPDRT